MARKSCSCAICETAAQAVLVGMRVLQALRSATLREDWQAQEENVAGNTRHRYHADEDERWESGGRQMFATFDGE